MRYLLLLLLCTTLTANDTADTLQILNTSEKFISKEEIQQRVQEVGRQITEDYADVEAISAVILMKGAICIAADLTRSIDHLLTYDFIRTKSYYKQERGKLVVTGLEGLDFAGKDVLIIDDVFDSGVTLYTVYQEIEKHNPRSLRSVVAFHKNINREISYVPEYILFDIEDRFLIGYGMDYDQYLRNLPDVYFVP